MKLAISGAREQVCVLLPKIGSSGKLVHLLFRHLLEKGPEKTKFALEEGGACPLELLEASVHEGIEVFVFDAAGGHEEKHRLEGLLVEQVSRQQADQDLLEALFPMVGEDAHYVLEQHAIIFELFEQPRSDDLIAEFVRVENEELLNDFELILIQASSPFDDSQDHWSGRKHGDDHRRRKSQRKRDEKLWFGAADLFGQRQKKAGREIDRREIIMPLQDVQNFLFVVRIQLE